MVEAQERERNRETESDEKYYKNFWISQMPKYHIT